MKKQNTNSKNVKEALRWIVRLLSKNEIPFQVTGGLAAHIYGAGRPIYDIDLDVPDKFIQKIVSLANSSVAERPAREHDEHFDLLLLTLKYQDVKIDISGCDSDRLFNTQTGKWEPFATNLKEAEVHEVYGLKLPIIRKDKLIKYKQKIGRPTDLEDVKSLKLLAKIPPKHQPAQMI